MRLGVADDANLAAQGLHHFALGDCLLGVVGTFAMNMRPQVAQNRLGGEVIKNHNVVHALDCRHQLRARFGGKQRPAFAFQVSNGPVTVYSHHEHIALLLRSLEIANVPNVEQVKTSVGKNDALPFPAPTLAPAGKFGACNQLIAHALRMASSSSCRVTVAVPRFITTKPPAQLAS